MREFLFSIFKATLVACSSSKGPAAAAVFALHFCKVEKKYFFPLRFFYPGDIETSDE